MKLAPAKEHFANKQWPTVDLEMKFGFEKKSEMKRFEGGRVSEKDETKISLKKKKNKLLSDSKSAGSIYPRRVPTQRDFLKFLFFCIFC